MRIGHCARGAIVAILVTRFAAGQASQPISNPPQLATTPTCQWGRCASVCPVTCPVGSVCGVDGICVQVVDPEDLQRERQRTEEDQRDRAQARRDAIEHANSRRRARYWTRFSVGGGLGGVSLVGRRQQAGLFVAHLGVRQQLDSEVGFHAQLIANYGLRLQRDESDDQKALTFQEVAASTALYFGPYRYFYLGPAVLVGYRRYSDAFKQWFAPGITVENHVLREGGLRLGLLVGNQEQFDITALFSSSFDENTPLRGQVSFAYEFR